MGDVISKLNGQPVPGRLELGDTIGNLQAGDTISIDFLRGGSAEKVRVRLDAKPEEGE